uniref:Reverse transcriptase domain-containing protein n=1 Tax=Capitella teleta TaxID=283909 RepID=X2BD01_CAPTE
YSLFSNRELGFINRRSMMLQLHHVLKMWSASLYEGNSVAVAYVDFQKAFDAVPHRHLLHELSKISMLSNGATHDKVLQNRSQCRNHKNIREYKYLVWLV